MHKLASFTLLGALAAFQVISCTNSPGGGDSKINLLLTSSDLSTSSLTRSGSNCSVTYESTTVTGKCYTPLKVSGFFNKATLGSTSGGDPVRLLGGGSTSGLEAVFKKAAFDLSTSPTLEGDDNIEDGGGTYNMMSLSIQGLEIAFEAEATNKVYRVRIPFTTNPPSANSTFSTCGLDGGTTEADTLGTLWSGITATAGDVLVCIKSAISETCEDTDFQWVDGSGNLQSTRPGSPKQVTGTHLLTADSCTAGSEHPDITWGNATFDVSLSSSVSVSASRGDSGTKTYTVGSQSGRTLTATIDVDTANILFVPTAALAADLSSQTQAAILGNIENILLKSIYTNAHKSTAASSSDGMLSATVTLAVE